ncbi:helix-turn-helix domain-containing protein [Saliterribacillus persicus]|uniref:AraC family transcriptional regulator n=1 Tax=Saliterribacillus persicus TaxID=930114 RepID=A0A368Y6I9_9BACI|nr:helix-turn-helix domain-containing protein [Saliterribacillus persicus]RCW74946.1 AraC family transcriptional regulator [Saliterribacillus persicus]
MSVKSYNELIYLCSLLYETFELPLALLDDNYQIEDGFPEDHNPKSYYIDRDEWLRNMEKVKNLSSIPLIKTTPLMETYLFLQIPLGEKITYTVVIGPVLTSKLTTLQFHTLMMDQNLSINEEDFLHYFEHLSITSESHLVNIAKLASQLINQKKIKAEDIMHMESEKKKNLYLEDNPEIQLQRNRENKTLHHDLMYERRIFQCIKEGNPKEFIKKHNTLPAKGMYGTLSKQSYLRDQKNLAISGITIGTRYAMEGGLNQETAYTLSDIAIQNIEEQTDVSKVRKMLTSSLADLAKRVQINKQKKYSKIINQALLYIFNQLYDPLSLEGIAKVINTNPSYLSSLFKQEVGINISTYIQKERIEEAKKLLELSDYPITKIAILLQFNDQSYFTKVFKKETNMTPKQYRNK